MVLLQGILGFDTEWRPGCGFGDAGCTGCEAGLNLTLSFCFALDLSGSEWRLDDALGDGMILTASSLSDAAKNNMRLRTLIGLLWVYGRRITTSSRVTEQNLNSHPVVGHTLLVCSCLLDVA